MIRSRSSNATNLESGSTVSSIGSSNKATGRMSKIVFGCFLCSFCSLITYGLIIFLNPVQSAIVVERPSDPKQNNRHLTVVINTFKRHKLLAESIKYYSSCDISNSIHIIWSEKDPPPQSLTSKFANKSNPKIVFQVFSTDSLNNRFKPLPGSDDEAILSVDDDMRIPCYDLKVAYQVWLGSKNSLIGFMPRIHLRGQNGKLVYRCWWRVWWHGVYSIILTKAAIFHRDYLSMYSNVMPSEIREFVDKRRNCEDIAMQFMIANATSLPPIYVKGHISDLGALNGISTSKSFVTAGHMGERSACLNELERIYGKIPLVPSRFFVDAASNGWTNSPSTWAEYISSDLWKW
eukprot:gene7485-10200_t